MVQLSKKHYYFLVFLLLLAVFYGYKKHEEASNQQDYLNPHLMSMINSIKNEIQIASSILDSATTENQIPYAQWIQLKNGLETIEHTSYEIEKIARAIYPSRAKELQNATKTTSYLMLSHLHYIEDNYLGTNMDRMDMITFPPAVQPVLEIMYNTTFEWREISSQYSVTNNIINRTDWVEMMKKIEEHSITFQEQYREIEEGSYD